MDISSRTTEGGSSDCPVCGKRVNVSSCWPLGDAACPHCNSLIFPNFIRDQLEEDAEKRLAEIGIRIETNDHHLGELDLVVIQKWSDQQFASRRKIVYGKGSVEFPETS